MRSRVMFCSVLVALMWGSIIRAENIQVGSQTRQMTVIAPSGLSNPMLIIQLHGMNQDAAYQKNASKWEPIAEREKIIVVFPEGINKSWDISGNRDLDFIKAIIDTMDSRHKIDRKRIYVSGFSMGGMMSYHVANKMSDKIAAVGPVSGYPMGGATATSTRPIPIMHIHGTTDDVVGFSGVAGTLSAWRNHLGCPSNSETIKPYPSGKSGSAATKQTWGPCDENSEVVLISIEGKGHWYSMDEVSVNSSEELLAFFKAHPLKDVTAMRQEVAKAENRLPATLTMGSSALQIAFTVSGNRQLSAQLFTMKGSLVFSAAALKRSGDAYSGSLRTAELPAGCYLLKISDGHSVLHQSELLLTK
ncbi:MAG: dienelactone hydrolase family protein [Chitinispirillaceae bacterium]|nr:dienelactone hydrolase family protein [Chitinispirillaceae bacterium]